MTHLPETVARRFPVFQTFPEAHLFFNSPERQARRLHFTEALHEIYASPIEPVPGEWYAVC